MPNFEKTLSGNEKRRLAGTYRLIAGVDPTGVPQLLQASPDGTLVASGPLALPVHDQIIAAATGPGGIGEVTQTITYKYKGATVAVVDVVTNDSTGAFSVHRSS